MASKSSFRLDRKSRLGRKGSSEQTNGWYQRDGTFPVAAPTGRYVPKPAGRISFEHSVPATVGEHLGETELLATGHDRVGRSLPDDRAQRAVEPLGLALIGDRSPPRLKPGGSSFSSLAGSVR